MSRVLLFTTDKSSIPFPSLDRSKARKVTKGAGGGKVAFFSYSHLADKETISFARIKPSKRNALYIPREVAEHKRLTRGVLEHCRYGVSICDDISTDRVIEEASDISQELVCDELTWKPLVLRETGQGSSKDSEQACQAPCSSETILLKTDLILVVVFCNTARDIAEADDLDHTWQPLLTGPLPQCKEHIEAGDIYEADLNELDFLGSCDYNRRTPPEKLVLAWATSRAWLKQNGGLSQFLLGLVILLLSTIALSSLVQPGPDLTRNHQTEAAAYTLEALEALCGAELDYVIRQSGASRAKYCPLLKLRRPID